MRLFLPGFSIVFERVIDLALGILLVLISLGVGKVLVLFLVAMSDLDELFEMLLLSLFELDAVVDFAVVLDNISGEVFGAFNVTVFLLFLVLNSRLVFLKLSSFGLWYLKSKHVAERLNLPT